MRTLEKLLDRILPAHEDPIEDFFSAGPLPTRRPAVVEPKPLPRLAPLHLRRLAAMQPR